MAIIGFRNKFITGEIGDAGMSQADPIHGHRMMGKAGDFNIDNVGTPRNFIGDMYLDLVRMKWSKFLCIIFGFLFGINIIFALGFYSIGPQFIVGLPDNSVFHSFLKTYLFSIQSFTTSGFGLSSTHAATTLFASFQAFCGLLIFAVITGLLYGRFSRPTARIVRSENALIAPYKNGKALMFRIANGRKKHMISNVEWYVLLAFNQQMGDKVVRRFHDLKLEVSKGLMFPLSWTIVHPMDEDSPLWNLSEQDFEDGYLQIMVMVNGFDESYHQTVYTKFSYIHEEIVWGAKFIVNFENLADGTMRHYVDRVSNFEKVALPN